MAVTIKNNNPMNLLKVFECKIQDMVAFKEAGGSITSSKGLLVFSQYGQPLVSIPLNNGVIKLVMAGKLGAASKAALTHKVHKALTEFLLLCTDSAKVLMAKTKIIEDTNLEDTVKFQAVPVTNFDKIKNMDPVSLIKADSMYQPVTATSPGSLYHVVCMSSDLKVAARIKVEDCRVSLRVEGKLEKHKERLAVAGFTISDNSEYYSMHLKPEDKVISIRSVAAVIALIPEPYTIMPNLELIIGLGS